MYKVVATLAIAVRLASAVYTGSHTDQFFLWVVDDSTGLGVPGAAVDIGPGRNCVGKPDHGDATWTAHYVTGPAGRVGTQAFFGWFSCRVTLGGRQLEVVSSGFLSPGPKKGPKWLTFQHASEISLHVRLTPAVSEDDLQYWEHTNDPVQFRAYIEDADDAQLLSGVTVTAVHSGVAATTDHNGLLRLDISARYWKGASPPGAMETLLFSKSGYRGYEYRNLILYPGVEWLDVRLERGSGTVIRKNGGRGGVTPDEFFELKPGEREKTDLRKGEISSLNIEPATYEGGWIVCTDEHSKAILKARNLKSVDIFWYSTGTGVGEMPPAKAGPMRKISSSSAGDTWEIEMPDLMGTNFWAQGTDHEGNIVKSMDLGNVSWDINLKGGTVRVPK